VQELRGKTEPKKEQNQGGQVGTWGKKTNKKIRKTEGEGERVQKSS